MGLHDLEDNKIDEIFDLYVDEEGEIDYKVFIENLYLKNSNDNYKNVNYDNKKYKTSNNSFSGLNDF